MADPVTSNIGLAVPAHGSDVDSWDLPLNANFVALDGLFGGVATIGLSNAPVVLTAPAGSGTATPGPTQAQNAVLKLTGTLTGNVPITLPVPGFYIVDHEATGNFLVTLKAPVAGDVIALPPGAQIHVFSDGTNVKFVNMGLPGQQIFFAGESALPAWVAACSKMPFLLADGAIYNTADYPTLGGKFGSKFGGNGSTTFGVEDLRGRVPLAYDGTGTRVTVGNCGINGQTMGAAGGVDGVILTAAQLAAHAHANSLNDPGHVHTYQTFSSLAAGGSGSNFSALTGPINVSTTLNGTGMTITNANAGGNSVHSNMPPAQVAGVWGVKT